MHRAEVDVEPQFLAQHDVDALVAAADGRGGGALQPDARHLERSENVVGQQLALLGERPRSGIHAFPFDAAPVASTARAVASATSGPMPSPGISVI